MHYRRGFGGDMGISQKKKKKGTWVSWIGIIGYMPLFTSNKSLYSEAQRKVTTKGKPLHNYLPLLQS
jgi:hypothetical protein